MRLENIIRSFKRHKWLEEGSFQCANQIMYARRNEDKLKYSYHIYTADGQGYFLGNNKSVYWVITREPDNLVLKHSDDEVNNSLTQIHQNKDFIPNNDEAETAKNAKDSVVIDMSGLNLQYINNEWCYLQINTGNRNTQSRILYKQNTPDEAKALDRLGYSEENLYMLRHAKHIERRFRTTRIYLLNPDYVIKKLSGSENISLWRTSFLGNFYVGSFFNAANRNISDFNILRGEIRK